VDDGVGRGLGEPDGLGVCDGVGVGWRDVGVGDVGAPAGVRDGVGVGTGVGRTGDGVGIEGRVCGRPGIAC
jgi:hypothetical protein